jgi:hypothetical protein
MTPKPTCQTCGSVEPLLHPLSGRFVGHCHDAFHRPQEPAPTCPTCSHDRYDENHFIVKNRNGTETFGTCQNREFHHGPKPALEGDDSEIERARRIFFYTVQDGAQSLPDVLQAVEHLVSAERADAERHALIEAAKGANMLAADAARQERRRTLEETRGYWLEGREQDEFGIWLNERIREAE